MTAPADIEFSFGSFRLVPTRQLLLDGDQPVAIGARALEILIALVERAGDVVSKGELIRRAWPNVVVEEGNLRTQMAILRRSLRDGEAGARYIVTVPGRGYRFVSSVSRSAEGATSSASARSPQSGSRIPIRLTRVIGREDTISAVTGRLSEGRFTTIVGPGGIGKTTVALAVAEQQAGLFQDGICFIDLASLIDPSTLPGTLAAKLGVPIAQHDMLPRLTAHLRDKHVLLVLDSCEKFVEAAAFLAETLLKETLALHILATSREPLRAEGEAIYRLSPLTTPATTSGRLTAQQALCFSAVELFVERASSTDTFALIDDDAPIVADICRQLDGIALAIELAAVRVGTLGVNGIAAYLKDRLRLLTRGRRTALPRHQTLEATLDWSYEMLSPREQATLRRLAIFAGNFALAGARAIGSESDAHSDDVLDVVDELVSKSLVSAEVGDGSGRAYRLLDTTRAYASKKLIESGEAEQISQRHARYCLNCLRAEGATQMGTPKTEFLVKAASLIDDIRAALNWAFASDANFDIAAELTTAAIPLWTHLSLNAECRSYVERALSHQPPGMDTNMGRDMRLFAALGATLIYTEGPGPKATTALENSLRCAEQLGDTDYQVRALWGLFQVRFNTGEFRNALLVERTNGDFALTTVRGYFYDLWASLALAELARSVDDRIAAIAQKVRKENAYHLRRSGDWMVRLGDGTSESHERMQRAACELWRYTGELFLGDEVDAAMASRGIGFDPALLRQPWLERVRETFAAATLELPPDVWMQRGGKRGVHTEALGYLLAEMQVLPRAIAGATW